jgi:hypothetical protein
MRIVVALVAVSLGLPAGVAGQARAPLPEPNFAAPILPPRPCAYEGHDPYEKRLYRLEGWKGPDFERYRGACERMRFAYGPILVKPGQNDVVVAPVVIEKPARNGYITRFKPDLVRADGSVPPVEQVHLHHGTWLSVPQYGGGGPWAASGEEKTIGSIPKGYGMPVRTTDQWQLLYMVHSAVPQPMEVFITYEIDFVPATKAADAGIQPIYPIWLDVRPSGYPVFNVQRQFGGADGKCTWPKEQCASFDPWGEEIVGQGRPGNGLGSDFQLPERGGSMGLVRSFQGGTLIGLAGHVHPGGLKDEVELVRGERSSRIFTSEAVYWDHRDHTRPGGPPTSWDLSMTAAGLPYWGVRVRPGDALRINATYDTTHQASYEDMGIVVAAIAPDRADGTATAPGLNPFKAPRDRSQECRSLRRRLTAPISSADDVGLAASPPVLCDRGVPTHGHQAANGNYGGASGQLTARDGAPTSQIAIADFQYFPGDLSRASGSGVPTVRLGSDLRFTNLEGTAIYHSITSCRFPCLGPTGAAFPIADGETSVGRPIDLDSGELGIGAPAIGPAKQTLNWRVPVTREAGFRAGETVTYFCRIHPFMRGAFKVAK